MERCFSLYKRKEGYCMILQKLVNKREPDLKEEKRKKGELNNIIAE